MPGRKYAAAGAYRYGFNGKENDNKDGVVQYDYGFRIYDPRLVRFKSVDPLTKSYPKLTPYQFASNCPIAGIDQDGLEFKLSITDPTFGSLFEAMLASPSYVSVQDMRKLTYDALHSTMSSERVEQIEKSQKFSNGDFEMDISGASATLTYDKDLPLGVTVVYNTANYAATKGMEYTQVFQKSVLIEKGTNKAYPDANYPVDVRTINSPEYKDYYKDNDFIGDYSSTTTSLTLGPTVGGNSGTTTIQGMLKGYGYVSYTSQGAGYSAGSPGWGITNSSGIIVGSSLQGNNFTPETLTGWGNQISVQGGVGGLGIEKGKWGSFNNQSDARNNKNATFSGTFTGVGVTLGIGGKSAAFGGVSKQTTLTTLDQRKAPHF